MARGKIILGSDHAGLELKWIIREFLTERGYKVEDLGPYRYDPDDDYPDYARKVCMKVLVTGSRGILICGSGQGMSIAANKIQGIYAAVCWNKTSARQAREHLNTNVLCLGADFVDINLAKSIVTIWLKVSFSKKKRHVRRVNKISAIEAKRNAPSDHEIKQFLCKNSSIIPENLSEEQKNR